VPVDLIKHVLKDLRSGKPVSRGYLGVSTRNLDKEFQSSLGVTEGTVVSDLVRGGPADKGGMQRLDVITAVDGRKVRNGDELIGAVSSHRAGETVKVTVVRDGKEKTLTVTLGDRKELQKGEGQEGEEDEGTAPKEPADEGKTLNLEKSYGFSVEALTPANRHQYGIAADWKGVVVTFVSARSEAGEKGLRPGFVISAVGTRDLQGLNDFNQEVKKAGKKPLLVLVRVPRGKVQFTTAIPHL